jgi:hypothetical protein
MWTDVRCMIAAGKRNLFWRSLSRRTVEPCSLVDLCSVHSYVCVCTTFPSCGLCGDAARVVSVAACDMYSINPKFMAVDSRLACQRCVSVCNALCVGESVLLAVLHARVVRDTVSSGHCVSFLLVWLPLVVPKLSWSYIEFPCSCPQGQVANADRTKCECSPEFPLDPAGSGCCTRTVSCVFSF